MKKQIKIPLFYQISWLTTLLICSTVCFPGCKTSKSIAVNPRTARWDVLLVVLADMIRGNDASLEPQPQEVSFVDAPTSIINELRRICGPAYDIYPVENAVTEEVHRPFTSEEYPLIYDYFLKGTHKSGVILRVKLLSIDGEDAEVGVGFRKPGSPSVFVYRLKHGKAEWQIVEREFIRAA